MMSMVIDHLPYKVCNFQQAQKITFNEIIMLEYLYRVPLITDNFENN